jgi:outer membrane cobalamin receptor
LSKKKNRIHGYCCLVCLVGLALTLVINGEEAFGQYYSGKESDSAEGEAVSEPAGTVTLESVTVTADRPEYEKILSPGTVSWIEPDKMAGEQKDLPSLLERVPGVMIRRQGTGQYAYATIRGSTGSQVSVYVDGVPQNTGGSQTVDLSLIPVHDVVRIEVYRGYVPNRFSGAPMGGVINIVTKRPEGLGGKAEVGMRSFGGYSGSLSVTAPLFNGSLLVGAGYDESDGDFKYHHPGYQINPADNPEGNRWRRSNSYSSTDLLLKWQNDNWLIRGSWKETDRYFPAPAGETMADLYDPTCPPHGMCSNNALRWQKVIQKDVSVGWNDTFWDRLNVSVRFDYLDNDRVYENRSPRSTVPVNIFPGQLWADYRTKRWSPVMDASLKVTDWNLLEFHGDYSDETFDVVGNNWLEHNSARSWELKPGYEQKTWHLQLQDTVTLDRNDSFWLTMIGRSQKVEGSDRGGRTNDYSAWEDDQWKYSWGASLKKEFKSIGLTAQTTYGTFYRYPSFYEIYGDGVFVRPGAGYSNAIYRGLERPSWEHGKQWDAGLSWRGDFLGANHYLAATYFKREMDDLISFVTTPRYWVIYQNVGKGEAKGFEFEANMSWPLFGLYMSATYLDAKITEVDSRFHGFIGSQSGPMINQPEWEYFARGDLALPWFDERVKLFAEYKYLDKIPFNVYSEYNVAGESRIVYEDELALTNMGLKWQATDGLDLTLGVNDVFNKGPEQGYVAYIGGRQMSVTDRPANGGVGWPNLVDYPQQGRTWYATVKYSF